MMDSPSLPGLLLEARQEADKLSRRVERLVALVEEAIVQSGSERARRDPGGHANGGATASREHA